MVRTPRQGPESLRLLPLHLAASVPPASTVTISKRIESDATLTGLRIRIYVGATLQLRLTPYIVNSIGQRRPLLAYGVGPGAKTWVDGDDDEMEFGLSEPIDADANETVCVDAQNLDPLNELDFAVTLSLDYSNGRYPGVHARG